METFAADWLTLREAADARSRNEKLLSHLRLPEKDPVRVIDLGAGTGSNLRYLSPRLSRQQVWSLVDQDKKLLDQAVKIIPNRAEKVTRKRLNLAKDLAKLDFTKFDLVTCSAFLDLVSASWLRSFIARLRKSHAPFLAALTYDGRVGWSPHEKDDRFVLSAFNTHQAGNKGFGPALGPQAIKTVKAALEKAGYSVRIGESAWKLTPGDSDLQRALLQGYKAAAIEALPDQADRIEDWANRRWRKILTAESYLVVGHRDLLATPKG